MPDRICYTVTATVPAGMATVLQEYVDWLKNGHVDRVVDGGAESATILLLDCEPSDAQGTPPARRVVTQYLFSSRDAFERYEREHAPALRAEGVERFGPQTGKGITFARSVGVIVAQR